MALEFALIGEQAVDSRDAGRTCGSVVTGHKRGSTVGRSWIEKGLCEGPYLPLVYWSQAMIHAVQRAIVERWNMPRLEGEQAATLLEAVGEQKLGWTSTTGMWTSATEVWVSQTKGLDDLCNYFSCLGLAKR